MNAASGSAAAHHEHPSRPFRAGFIAGHGSTLWLLDVSRPILVRRARDGACSTHAVPGHLRTSGIVGWTPVRLHPDAAGCWVAGVDGTAHCSHDGTVRALDPEPVRASALYAGVLATVARADASTLALRGVSGETVTVALPAEADSVCAADEGFVVLMRTDAQGRAAAWGDSGLCCARIGFDGRMTLGDPWPRAYRRVDRPHLVDVGQPMVVARGGASAVLGESLLPALTVPFGSVFESWPTRNGPWSVATSEGLARQCRDDAFRVVADGTTRWFSYFRLDRDLTGPEFWAAAPGFPRSVAVLDDPGQLWISTFEGLFVSMPGALGRPGRVEVVEAEPLRVPELPVTPPPDVGDPEVYAYRECDRLIAENSDQGLLDARPVGRFPFTEIVVLFSLPELPAAVCARRIRLFDRDGRPALWRGAPTLMEHISLSILESGGAERVRRIEPGIDGWVWV
ncbi:hypothetical protein A4U94_00490 [Prescottella equi]|uniref:Uncharacterized protein n=1 Tax=Rhodococcus hoagii TaxID=43767 RepID=A0AAE4ZJ32_RHOHA|nr:hypothetical protein [Prescottella equi]MBM4634251.1 hypothetical protein [Prescottella equi]MBM4725529.1 hypothetical protein [Prescottella equi]NKS27552.1 hypothetical protein [Prescottella equi]OQQ25603.1 hypothetical protein A6411_19475 [Prescottella equi]OQQ28566.1 hypothetical protein A4U94_00490 [Prescottella equi]